MTKPFGAFAVVVLAVTLTGAIGLPGRTVGAGRDASGASHDFARYLSDSKLPSLQLVELKRLCLEAAELAACRECADLLRAEGRSGEVVAFADSLRSSGRESVVAALLIKSYGLFGVEDWPRAIEALDSLVALLPSKETMVEAILLRSECQLKLGLADEALLNLEAIEALIRPDQRLRYLICRGTAEEASGDLANAAGFFQAAWKDGSAEAGAGLLRCNLRNGKIDACLALQKELAKRGTALPPREACELAAVAADVGPGLWRAIMKPVVSDTAWDMTGSTSALASTVRLAEAGEDVAPYCYALIDRNLPDALHQRLRYARALHYDEPERAADSLASVAKAASDPWLKLRCLSAFLAVAPERKAAVVKDLGTGLRPLFSELTPDERLALGRALVPWGAEDLVLGEIVKAADALKPGPDDQALAEIAGLALAAGDTAKALELYETVSASPWVSPVSLGCERGAFVIRNLSGPKADIAKEVEKIAKKGASDIELGDLFMEKLRDYERASTYYRKAIDTAPEGAAVDRVKLRLAKSLSLTSLAADGDSCRAEAVGLVASVARSKSVKPEDVLEAVKMSTFWLDRDGAGATEILVAVASRSDLTSNARCNAAGLLLQLFAAGFPDAYDPCAALLTGLITEPSSSKQAPLAALSLARLKLLNGDYTGARDGFTLCAGRSRDPVLVSMAKREIGKCYIHSGGMAAGLDYLKQSGRSQETRYLIGRCFEALGQRDSSEAYYRAGLESPGTALTADRLRLRLGLALTASGSLEAGRDALDSPLAEVRERLRVPRQLVTACALDSAGYGKLGELLLESAGAGSTPFAWEASLLLSRLVARTDKARARQLVLAARPGTDDVFDGYVASLERARYACSGADPGSCLESKQEFDKSFPLDRQSYTELELRGALAAAEEAADAAVIPQIDSLVASGVKHPMMPEVLYRSGVGRLVGGDYEGAEKTFRRILDDYPGCELERDACFKLGSIYYLTENYESSALYYGLAALSAKASLARDALFNYSLALEQVGDFGKAAGASSQLAVRFPFSEQFERSLVRAGYCLQAGGRPMEAIRLYGGVLQYTTEAETMAETHYWIAECFSDAGNHVRAACEFLRTAYLYPKQAQWSGTAAYGAGDECEKAGLAREAVVIYRQNVRAYGKASEWGRASDERLAELVARRQSGESTRPAGKEGSSKEGPAAEAKEAPEKAEPAKGK